MGEAQCHDLVGGDPGKGFPVEEDPPAGGLEEAGEGAQGGGLARTVGADEGDDLAGLDGEGDSLDGFDLAVGDPEVLDLEQCGHWPSPSVLVVLPALSAVADSASGASAFSGVSPSKGVPR